MRNSLVALGAILSCATAGCAIRSWDDYRTESSIASVASDGTFPSQTFGTLLASYRRVLPNGDQVSRLVVGSGRIDVRAGVVDGMYGVFSGWQQTRLRLGTKLYDHCEGTGAGSSCPPDTGTTLIAIPDMADRQGCVLAGAPLEGAESVVVSCETTDTGQTTALRTIQSGAPLGSRLGSSLAAVPEEATDLGVALAGAPGEGTLYALSADAAFAALPVGGHPVATDFGSSLASAPITTLDAALLATLPPGDQRAFVAVGSVVERRVYLLVARTQAGQPNDAVVVGCIDGPQLGVGADDGFGAVLAAGDLTGDGMPELVLGAGLAALDREELVRIVSLADLGAPAGVPIGCADPSPSDDPVTRTLACVDDVASSETICGGYGASLALGDVDGDGTADLLVGAPLTSVRGVAHAGAAYLYASDASLDVLVSAVNAPAVLVDSSPDVNDTLGLAVTFLPSQLALTSPDARAAPRAEPVASAPGKDRIYVFLCSGLAGDARTEGIPRCIVQD